MVFDLNGYEIRHEFDSRHRTKYMVLTPSGDAIRKEGYRHEDGAHGAASRHFDQSKPTVKRKCLCCETVINSTGYGHRRCGPCRAKSVGMD